jgi:flagellar basal-body rod protein FlgG
MLINLVNEGADRPSRTIGTLNTGTMVEEVLPIWTQGPLQETANASDLALISNIRVFEEVDGVPVEIRFDASGRGVNQAGETVYQPQAFYTVWNEAGEVRYTRNSQMVVDAEGLLRTTDGHRVLGQDGQPIALGRSLDSVRVTPAGVLLDEQGEVLGSLLITRIDNPYALIREGAGVYRLEGNEAAAAAADPDDFEIRQGFVERSNVDPAQSVTDLMVALRAYEANQRIVQYYDKSLEKAVNEVGRV